MLHLRRNLDAIADDAKINDSRLGLVGLVLKVHDWQRGWDIQRFACMRNGQGSHGESAVTGREKVKKYWLYGNVSLGFDGHGYVQDKDKYEIW